MIETPTIIITSVGRTGTMWFQQLFEEILDDAVSLHEPKNKSSIKRVLDVLSKNTIMNHSNHNLADNVEKEELIKRVRSLRQGIDNNNSKFYVESNYKFYGLINILPEVFNNVKIIYIVRNGIDCVNSHMNRGVYSRFDFHTWLNDRITPINQKDRNYRSLWNDMDRFSRLCWYWQYINRKAIEMVGVTPGARLVKFEDIFSSTDKEDNIKELVGWCSDDHYDIPFKKLYQKVNENKKPIIIWNEENQHNFDSICSGLMNELGYIQTNERTP